MAQRGAVAPGERAPHARGPSAQRLSVKSAVSRVPSCVRPARRGQVVAIPIIGARQNGRTALHKCAAGLFSDSPTDGGSSSSSRSEVGGEDWSTPSPDAHVLVAREVERSSLANEEIVYFIFQLDLDTQLQRALNYEAYEQAASIRTKRQRVDEALDEMRERKASNLGSSSSSGGGAAKEEVVLSVADVAAEGLRLRTAMARAVEKEDYKEAAMLRDMLGALEVQARRAQSLAEETSGGQAFQPRFRLGQRVVHQQHGYRGVVAGWDARCCEGEDWLEAVGPEARARMRQPHYHVLVDHRDWEYNSLHPPVAYVAEELCWAPELGGPLPSGLQGAALKAATAAAAAAAAAAVSSAGGAAPPEEASWPPVVPVDTPWREVFGPEPLAHPYMYILFLGQDAHGDYVPCRQLRSKYNVARRDVGTPPSDEGN